MATGDVHYQASFNVVEDRVYNDAGLPDPNQFTRHHLVLRPISSSRVSMSHYNVSSVVVDASGSSSTQFDWPTPSGFDGSKTYTVTITED